MKLNLGCGKDIKKGYINLDIKDFGQEIVRDARRGLPFDDNKFDFILAHNFFEHLDPDDVIFVMNECWRVLINGGILEIVVPKFPDPTAVVDPTHKSFWTAHTFKYFTGERPKNADYGIKRWKLISLEDRETSFKVKLQTNKINL